MSCNHSGQGASDGILIRVRALSLTRPPNQWIQEIETDELRPDPGPARGGSHLNFLAWHAGAESSWKRRPKPRFSVSVMYFQQHAAVSVYSFGP
jgi:hypothetical protein